jgi:ketosteroid isomerase-like protein
MDGTTSAEQVGRALIDAFCALDTDRMRSLLADDLRAYITNRDGGVDAVGADEYIRRIEAMDLPSARFTVTVTQAIEPRPDMAVVMVEVKATRGERTLHNHAAHCLFVRDGRVREWWMVEALPAESDAFWAAAPA